MSKVPSDVRYASTHEWLKLAADGSATVGISDYAQASLGDITFVQLPAVGAELAAGAAMGVIESVKAASDVYAPVAGTVVEVNRDLEAKPELVNHEPYGAGWLIKLRVKDASSAEALMDAAAYTAHTS